MGRPAVDLLIVICALAFAALTVAAAAVAVWRARATADTRVAEAVQMLASGMHETMRDLAGSIDTAQRNEPSQALTQELAASLDVTKVAERTLAALEAIPGVQAAALETPATSVSTGLQPQGGRACADWRAGQRQPASDRGLLPLPDRRIARAVRARPILGAGTPFLSAGAAELREGDRPNDLFERADDALYRAKELGKARTVLANGA